MLRTPPFISDAHSAGYARNHRAGKDSRTPNRRQPQLDIRDLDQLIKAFRKPVKG